MNSIAVFVGDTPEEMACGAVASACMPECIVQILDSKKAEDIDFIVEILREKKIKTLVCICPYIDKQYMEIKRCFPNLKLLVYHRVTGVKFETTKDTQVVWDEEDLAPMSADGCRDLNYHMKKGVGPASFIVTVAAKIGDFNLAVHFVRHYGTIVAVINEKYHAVISEDIELFFEGIHVSSKFPSYYESCLAFFERKTSIKDITQNGTWLIQTKLEEAANLVQRIAIVQRTAMKEVVILNMEDLGIFSPIQLHIAMKMEHPDCVFSIVRYCPFYLQVPERHEKTVCVSARVYILGLDSRNVSGAESADEVTGTRKFSECRFKIVRMPVVENNGRPFIVHKRRKT